MGALRAFVDREKKSGRGGLGVLRRLVNQRDPDYQPSASELQAVTRRLLIGAGLTNYIEEFVILDAEGNFVARVDFGFQDLPVAVEFEGRANHSSKRDFQHDLERRNRITGAGWAAVHATADMVRFRQEEFLAAVRAAREAQARLRGLGQ